MNASMCLLECVRVCECKHVCVRAPDEADTVMALRVESFSVKVQQHNTYIKKQYQNSCDGSERALSAIE